MVGLFPYGNLPFLLITPVSFRVNLSKAVSQDSPQKTRGVAWPTGINRIGLDGG
jgi:hypothetical protein